MQTLLPHGNMMNLVALCLYEVSWTKLIVALKNSTQWWALATEESVTCLKSLRRAVTPPALHLMLKLCFGKQAGSKGS